MIYHWTVGTWWFTTHVREIVLPTFTWISADPTILANLTGFIVVEVARNWIELKYMKNKRKKDEDDNNEIEDHKQKAGNLLMSNLMWTRTIFPSDCDLCLLWFFDNETMLIEWNEIFSFEKFLCNFRILTEKICYFNFSNIFWTFNLFNYTSQMIFDRIALWVQKMHIE